MMQSILAAYKSFTDGGKVMTTVLYTLFFVESIVLVVLAIVQNITNNGMFFLLPKIMLSINWDD